jgi:Reverse transcriptase (RNA-dependent DNA polymerase)
MSKIVERLVCHQQVEFFECHNLLPSLQSAYRRKHSTETAVLKVITDAFTAADKGEATLLCMLDLSAAFDTVNHDILIDRLNKSFGVNGQALSWI